MLLGSLQPSPYEVDDLKSPPSEMSDDDVICEKCGQKLKYEDKKDQPKSNEEEEEDDEDDEEEANISLAAMEAELKPQVLETFDRIANRVHRRFIAGDQEHQ